MPKGSKPAAKLLPAYLIVGEDRLKSDEVLARLVARVQTMGDLELNSETFDCRQEASGQAIVEAANTLPFLSDVRLIVVKEPERLAKADSEQLVAYLKDPNPTTVMALVATKLAKNTRLYKAAAQVGPHAVIDCSPRKARDLPSLVEGMARSHGAAMGSSAAAALVDRVGTSTVLLDAEVAKLASVARSRGDGSISADDVERLVKRIAEVKPWDLTRALAERDVSRCLTLTSRMRDAPRGGRELSWTGLLAMCVTRIRELICAKSLDRRGDAGALADEVRKFNPRAQAWQLRDHRRWASRWETRDLRRALTSAADAEQRMKSGADQQAAFERWLIAACAGGKRA